MWCVSPKIRSAIFVGQVPLVIGHLAIFTFYMYQLRYLIIVYLIDFVLYFYPRKFIYIYP